ncbi:uncharacterized protein LOC124272183 isoform X1 [Haliotis rubra]|uniref:uncharacterized protein LOC124272183 isoform X1 n=1 Tax=Haliotis rubra TaxID=36100 RepID=UPI001EE53CD1|nr:uncharacterized protein LOC124272183 isoform X1 [Haliotis rubra]
MKSLLILFCVVGLIHSAHSGCISCKGGTPDASCDDPYSPSGPESAACSSFHRDLCTKYGGSYHIACGSFTTSVSCTVTCGAGPLTPSLLLMATFLAFAIKMVH